MGSNLCCMYMYVNESVLVLLLSTQALCDIVNKSAGSEASLEIICSKFFYLMHN